MISDLDLQEFRDYMNYNHGKCKFEECRFPAGAIGEQCLLGLHIDTSALESAIKERNSIMAKDTLELKKEDFAVLCAFMIGELDERGFFTEEDREYIKKNGTKFEALIDSSKMHTFEEVKVYLDQLFKE